MSGYVEKLNERYKAIAQTHRTPAPRVALVCDREWLNTLSIIDYGNNHPTGLELAGIVVPGGEFDPEIIQIADRVRDMKTEGIATPIIEEDNTIGFQFLSPQSEFRYLHAPYDANLLRNDPEKRRLYCEKLADMVEGCGPDIIFLSNFKIILDPVFVQRFSGRIVNVHPSLLPFLKGFRPESRADEGENPESTGYTFHLVEETLDGGPTLFQQRVPIDPYDSDKEKALGEKAYKRMREEQLRLKIITAQSLYTPRILELTVNGPERRIVEDEEAFAYEGRSNLTIENGFHYRRLLFKTLSGWETAERILGTPAEAKINTPDVMTEYIFEFRGSGTDTTKSFMEVLAVADTVRSERGGGYFQTRSQYYQDGVRRASIFLPYDLATALEGIGIPYETRIMPTRVLATRQPISFVRDEN